MVIYTCSNLRSCFFIDLILIGFAIMLTPIQSFKIFYFKVFGKLVQDYYQKISIIFIETK